MCVWESLDVSVYMTVVVPKPVPSVAIPLSQGGASTKLFDFLKWKQTTWYTYW